MRFAEQPTNLEALRGGESALRLQVLLADLPDGATGFRVFAARTAKALSLATVTALGENTLSLPDIGSRSQDDANDGLRELGDVGTSQALGGAQVAVEGRLFESAYDMALAWDGAQSFETDGADPTKGRSDMAWFVAAVCTDGTGNLVVAQGGLGQWAGQEHLAGVWLSPSNLTTLREVGEWLLSSVRSWKPLLDAAVAQVRPAGTDWALDAVTYTDEELTDKQLVIHVMPSRAADNPAGIAAPDRREQIPAYTLRAVCYGDDPEARVRVLEQVADRLSLLLNTRKFREVTLPSGNILSLCFASNISFGKTQDTGSDAADVTWSARLTRVGMF